MIVKPTLVASFTVFAQRHDARLELDAWTRNAERFFATRLSLDGEAADPGAPDEPFARESTSSIVVSPVGRPAGHRVLYARPRADEDLARALAAEGRAGVSGLGDLARRCGYVWLVARESEGDLLALLLAAIVASVVLGPILSPEGTELFGVKTAREKLARALGQ